MADVSSRRRFIRGVAAASAVVGGAVGVSPVPAQQAGRIRGFDHVALPMENTGAMLAFYRALGCDVIESATACSVHFGDNMINFHRPTRWQDVHESSSRRSAALRRSLLRVGRHDRLRESCAGTRWGKGRVRSGSQGGWPSKNRFERLRARPGWKPPRIHDLPVNAGGVATLLLPRSRKCAGWAT
jgi:hypothetical protein